MKNDTMHPFERVGLGKAPFTFTGSSEKVFISHPGATPRSGGSCDFCGTAITMQAHVRSADGKEFKIGFDCAKKLSAKSNMKSDPVLVAIGDERRKLQRIKTQERNEKQIAEGVELLATHREVLEAVPNKRNGSLAVMADWWFKNAGQSGKAKMTRWIKEELVKQGLI